MKIRLLLVVFVLIVAMNAFGVNLQLDNGVVVQTYIGTRPTSESGFGKIVLDGQLLDSPDAQHTGYLDGIVETTNRASVGAFAGMVLSSNITSTVIRRVTQITSGAGGAPPHFKRYYRITNNGSPASGTMTFNFVSSGTYNETNSVPSPWVIWGDGDYWNSNPVTASPMAEGVTVPSGSSVWLGVENIVTNATVYARVFLEGPYRTHLQLQPGDPGDTMYLDLRHSPRSEPPVLYKGDCVIPVISPYPDHRDSGYNEPGDIPEKIVDWVYLRFRSGANLPENSCFIQLGNGYTGYSCYLRNDGYLVDVDGSEGVTVPGLQEGEYYLFIAHRNHLTVLSATPVNTANLTDYTTNYYDFTTGFNKFYKFWNDNGVYRHIMNNKVLVGAGDAPYDGNNPIKTEQVEGIDENYWTFFQGILGYHDADYNMGVHVEGFDLNTVKKNSEESGQIRSPLSWPAFTPDTCP
ncbi:hypothetical protein JW935_09450 [candidate division KSB1 bacterium]|nr:hypothetical protein [candidate division KSB1 bacterium]